MNFLAGLETKYPWMDKANLTRMVRSYGSKISDVIGDATSQKGMGQSFGGGLTAREAKYLMTHEWAKTAEDILWRRTKCGLHMSEDERAHFKNWVSK